MNKFTYTLAALTVMFSVNTYAQVDDVIEETEDPCEKMTCDTSPNISDEKYEELKKQKAAEDAARAEKEKAEAGKETAKEESEEEMLKKLANGDSVVDPVPEKERITADTPRDINETIKPNISDEEIAESGKKFDTAERPVDTVLLQSKQQTLLTTESVATVTALGSTVALNNVSARLGGNRSGNNHSGLTASLGGMLAPAAENSGLWVSSKYAKLQRHQSKTKNFGVQVGYDHPFQLESAVLRLGLALDMEKAKSTIASDRLNSRMYGATLYGSYETPSSHYIDFFARAARTSFELTNANKFHNKTYSFALAYSKLFEASDKLAFEPRAQLTYSRIGSSHFVKDNLAVHVNSAKSLVSTLGLKSYLGINNAFSLYGKVEWNKELLGKNSGSVGITHFSYKHKASWTTLGLGVKSNLSKNASLYFDADSYLGNGYKNSYQLNLGLNVKF